jgi:hypothetical protein
MLAVWMPRIRVLEREIRFRQFLGLTPYMMQL